MLASPENLPLLAELLADQQRLQTPVARFAESDRVARSDAPAPFRDLIPLTRPGAGERYAFEVDLDACSGCKSCVAACHSLNGLDDHESWRDVGLLIGGNERAAYLQTVTTACHHCEDPACLNGCPVLAYEQDPLTGIVRHLDDQCIGCQYCVLKCPYDVPKYNARLGIVRKCDMCHGRLSAGEAPACAQACPTHAIRIVNVPATQPSPAAPHALVPGAPDSGYTRPATRYRSKRPLPAGLVPADAGARRLQPTHWPLVVMLTFVPAGLASTLLATVLAWRTATTLDEPSVATLTHQRVVLGWWALGAGAVGLGASVLHLGQPTRAWRIFLGWRRSWLSREAMLLGAWVTLLGAAVVGPAIAGGGLVPIRGALTAGAALGLGGWLCSMMVYIDTHRVAWRATRTAGQFGGGLLACVGAAGLLAGLPALPCGGLLAGASLVKLALEARLVRAADVDDDAPPTAALDTARLLDGPLRLLFATRLLVGVLANVGAAVAVLSGAMGKGGLPFLAGAVFAGELADRYLFFRSVDAPKMPGLPAPAGGTSFARR